MTRLLHLLLLTVILATCCHGCADKPAATVRSYQTVAVDPRRDTETARECNTRGAELLDQDDLAGAEAEFIAALEADLFFGPAHSNLGAVYYRQKHYYKAAWEYQYAAKIMPGVAAPHNNLGLLYETVGKIDPALASFSQAHKLAPAAIEITVNLARIRIRKKMLDDDTRDLLHEIIRRGNTQSHIDWAAKRLAEMKTPPATSNDSLDQTQ